jgi:two-component system, NarL family, sensor histidine kinase DesK
MNDNPAFRESRRSWAVSSFFFFFFFFALFMIPSLARAISSDYPPALAVLLTIGIVAYGAGYVLLPMRLWRSTKRWQIVGGVAYMVAAALLWTVGGPYMFIWAFVLCAVVLPSWWLVVVNGSVLVVLVFVAGADHVELFIILVSVTVLCGAVVRMVDRNQELRAARDRVAALAAANERGRIARDLHDVLGHSLTTITVKAGLARRMLESAGATERALAEMREVRQLSLRALTDITATVSGERAASLAAELVGAKEALRSAGIATDFPLAVDDVAPAYQEAFAFALREGVTNVLRHSTGATRCEVRLGGSWLEVRDDGDPRPAAVASSRTLGGGNGLSGLSERLGGIGARLEAGPLPSQGFRLRVEVPA